MSVPSPAVKPPTAAELLDKIQARGGRLYRMHDSSVCCLTDDAELAEWLTLQGATYPNFTTNGGRYQRANNKTEFDLWVHQIPVDGDLTLAELL